MRVHPARHHGMCFGGRDALRATHGAARRNPVTILGQLMHNPAVDRNLATLGMRWGDLDDRSSVATRDVVITAHGASDAQRDAWTRAGFRVTDTTCPLVSKAHDALAQLVADGYFPLEIGQEAHVEVRALVGDFPASRVILHDGDVATLDFQPRFGVVSQITQRLDRVLRLVDLLKRRHPRARSVSSIRYATPPSCGSSRSSNSARAAIPSSWSAGATATTRASSSTPRGAWAAPPIW